MREIEAWRKILSKLELAKAQRFPSYFYICNEIMSFQSMGYLRASVSSKMFKRIRIERARLKRLFFQDKVGYEPSEALWSGDDLISRINFCNRIIKKLKGRKKCSKKVHGVK